MILSDKVYTPQDYLKAVLNKNFELNSNNEVEEIEVITESADENLWSYPLTEIEHILEENMNVVLVKCKVLNKETGVVEDVYRWFECNFD